MKPLIGTSTDLISPGWNWLGKKAVMGDRNLGLNSNELNYIRWERLRPGSAKWLRFNCCALLMKFWKIKENFATEFTPFKKRKLTSKSLPANNGGSQPTFASQCESRNNKTSPEAWSAPYTLARINPSLSFVRTSLILGYSRIYSFSFSFRCSKHNIFHEKHDFCIKLASHQFANFLVNKCS